MCIYVRWGTAGRDIIQMIYLTNKFVRKGISFYAVLSLKPLPSARHVLPVEGIRVGPLSRTARPVAQAKSSITTSAKLRLPATHKTHHLYNFSR